MVNISVIEMINKLIAGGNVNQMKKWSERHRSTLTSNGSGMLISKIRSLLVLISGNDMIEMLKSFFFFIKIIIIFRNFNLYF